ncbi:hypothetical protein LINPERHAP1_LOCUS2775 [Linum perenne]
MGLLSWFKGSPQPKEASGDNGPKPAATEIAGMNGAVEVPPRPPPQNVTVFEFGTVGGSSDKVTLAGFCPVSEDLEPCRWEILPSTGSDAPQFRVVF